MLETLTKLTAKDDKLSCAIADKIIAERQLLSEDGIVVMEQSDTESVSEIDGLNEIKSKKYGRTYIRIYALS